METQQQESYLSMHTARQNAIRRSRAPRMREIMRRLVMGEDSHDIAEDLGMTKGAMAYVIRSPLFQAELERFASHVDEASYKAMEELRKEEVHAVRVYTELLQDTSDQRLHFHVAKDLLSRTGIAAAKQVNVTQNSTSYEERLIRMQSEIESEAPPTRIAIDVTPRDTDNEEDD
jgi:hypothetical protein